MRTLAQSMPVHEREYILYCDESIKDGRYYSNFYGGALVAASQLEKVTRRLAASKLSLNLCQEIKWQRVTDQYLSKYIAIMDAFFDEIATGNVKLRVMFRQNARKPVGLTEMQIEQAYYILYYQFIKHAFGFGFMPDRPDPVALRAYFDQFPDTGEQVARFRGYILGLNESREFRKSKLAIRPEDFTEVRSHEHVILQCLDIVLGAMAFRLNDQHKVKPKGSSRRGRRTIAKEKLYNHIRGRILLLRPNFNTGITTGGTPEERWTQPYRHWAFVPNDHEFDASLTKRQK